MENNNNTLPTTTELVVTDVVAENKASSGLYTDLEETRLESNIDVRSKVIEKLTKDGIPENLNVLRVLDIYLMGSDNSIHKKAENRTKHQQTQNTEETLAMVAGLLKTVTNESDSIDNSETRQLDLDSTVVPLDTVEGETSTGVTVFDIEDFTGDK